VKVKVRSKGANQFFVEYDGWEQFQSYKSVVAERKRDGTILLDRKYWNYSRTTMKYLGIFLGMKSKDIRENVSRGTFILTNLNANG